MNISGAYFFFCLRVFLENPFVKCVRIQVVNRRRTVGERSEDGGVDVGVGDGVGVGEP